MNKKLISYLILVITLAITTILYFYDPIDASVNHIDYSLAATSHTFKQDNQHLQKVRDLRLPFHKKTWIKFHILDENGRYLPFRIISFFCNFTDTLPGKGSTSNSCRNGETIMIFPFVAENDFEDGDIRLIMSNTEYVVHIYSDSFADGMSKDVMFTTPQIEDGKSEYQVYLKFVEKGYRKRIAVHGELSQNVEAMKHTVNYFKDGSFLNDYLPQGNKFEINVDELGGELMVGGGEKQAALLYCKKVDDARVTNPIIIDYKNLKEYNFNFQEVEHDAMLDFLSGPDSRLPLGWKRITKGSKTAKVFLSPGEYYYRFSKLDSSRDISQNPNGKITVEGNTSVYDLSNIPK
jgi:hypothetical protein